MFVCLSIHLESHPRTSLPRLCMLSTRFLIKNKTKIKTYLGARVFWGLYAGCVFGVYGGSALGKSPVVTDDCRIDLSGLQSAIKMIRLIILAAVRKGY